MELQPWMKATKVSTRCPTSPTQQKKFLFRTLVSVEGGRLGLVVQRQRLSNQCLWVSEIRQCMWQHPGLGELRTASR